MNSAIRRFASLVLLIICCTTVSSRARDDSNDPTIVANILASKNCDQVLVSPDKLWLAATRTYTAIDPGQIWKNTYLTCLVVWDVLDDGDSSPITGDKYVRWDCPSGSEIVKIGWSPDSRFLLIVTRNASGNQPYLFPTLIFCAADNTIRTTGDLAVLSSDLKFIGPHTVQFKTGLPGAEVETPFDLGKQMPDLPILVRLKTQEEE
jgi:hypothetical protein